MDCVPRTVLHSSHPHHAVRSCAMHVTQRLLPPRPKSWRLQHRARSGTRCRFSRARIVACAWSLLYRGRRGTCSGLAGACRGGSDTRAVAGRRQRLARLRRGPRHRPHSAGRANSLQPARCGGSHRRRDHHQAPAGRHHHSVSPHGRGGPQGSAAAQPSGHLAHDGQLDTAAGGARRAQCGPGRQEGKPGRARAGLREHRPSDLRGHRHRASPGGNGRCALERPDLHLPQYRPLTYLQWYTVVRKAFIEIGLSTKQYGTQSSTRGGATALYNQTGDVELVESVGGRSHRSGTARSYVELQ